MITIRQATPSDAGAVTALAQRLWPDHSADELRAEFSALLADPACAVFLALCEALPVGFAQCQLRHDYVEGASSSPVGYLEGVFTAETVRKQGVALRLLTACQDWAKAQGCAEFASDCQLSNADSRSFHLSAGFAEVGQIICFLKRM